MTAPAAVTGKCAVCGHQIVHVSGPSWRHQGRTRDTRIHPAEPDQATRRLLQEAS